ncbi:MAG: efflux RND transporter periplasmic adaptor subunit, partial [Pseudomonadota bacterium]|nr:efflux RND transporter periplasmic adaptor subunit [Pseudomonadota bacterium]
MSDRRNQKDRKAVPSPDVGDEGGWRARAGDGYARARSFLRLAGKAVIPAFILLLALATYSGLKATKPEVPQRPKRATTLTVRTEPVKFADHQPTLTLYGQTVAGRRVELRSLVAGEVIETGAALREGGVVAKDEVLLRIDPFRFQGALDEARAGLAEARAKLAEIDATIANEELALTRAREQLAIAERDLERAVPLVSKGTVSEKAADDRRMIVSERRQGMELRRSNLDVQKARADQQRALIAQFDWRVRQAERNLRDTVLHAPYDAYVTQVSAQVGKILGVNDPVASLLDRNWIDVRFTLSDQEYGRIAASGDTVVGRRVEVVWRVGDKPLVYPGRIERVAAEISAASGGVEVHARLDDPSKPIPIRAGAFVEVTMPDRNFSGVAKLPQTALYGGDRVYVMGVEGKPDERKVELVGASGDSVLLRGSIAAGEKVIVTRIPNAGDGVR